MSQPCSSARTSSPSHTTGTVVAQRSPPDGVERRGAAVIPPPHYPRDQLLRPASTRTRRVTSFHATSISYHADPARDQAAALRQGAARGVSVGNTAKFQTAPPSSPLSPHTFARRLSVGASLPGPETVRLIHVCVCPFYGCTRFFMQWVLLPGTMHLDRHCSAFFAPQMGQRDEDLTELDLNVGADPD